MLPSEVLSMTLPMFELLTIQGTKNAKTLTNIVNNLNELYKALLRIEAEAKGKTPEEEENTHDADDGQGQGV